MERFQKNILPPNLLISIGHQWLTKLVIDIFFEILQKILCLLSLKCVENDWKHKPKHDCLSERIERMESDRIS